MTLSLHKLLLSGAATALAALTLSTPALADEPGTDARCYAAANAQTVGQADWKGCAGMYIVKDILQLISNFRDFRGVTHEGINYTAWDSAHNVFTGQVTVMEGLFARYINFNEDIRYWDTSNVTNFKYMFDRAGSFNQDIGDWDTSKATDMAGMFSRAGRFNQDISGWNVNNVSSKPDRFDYKTSDAWTDDKKPVWGTDDGKPAAASVPARPARRAGGLHDVGEWDRAMKAGAPRSTMKAGWTYDMYMNAEPSDSELSATEPSDAEPSAAEQFIVPGSVFPLAGEFSLVQGRKYPSPNGSYYLIFRDDGNVVVYTIDDEIVWGLNDVTDKYGSIAKVVQQADGNFAAYDKSGGWIWSARSVVSPAGTKLHLGGFGALTLVGPDGAVLWSSK